MGSMVTFVSALLKSYVVFYDIIVDNKSATGKNKNILFLPDKKYGFKKKGVGAILAASLVWAHESFLAKVQMRTSSQSILYLWVESLQLDSRNRGSKLPINTFL